MNSLWKIASLAVATAVFCGCSTMKDSTRFNDLPTHYWNSLATEPLAAAQAPAAYEKRPRSRGRSVAPRGISATALS
jgi:hypothetical protein